jgi:hypothetical protein
MADAKRNKRGLDIILKVLYTLQSSATGTANNCIVGHGQREEAVLVVS